jgi:hypothetical protein
VTVYELAITNVFDGFNLTILDNTTPAVDMRGRINDRNFMCFVSATGKEIAALSFGDYQTLMRKHGTVVTVAGGGTLLSPPGGYTNWTLWFTDEFNKHRGLSVGDRAEAVAANTADTIEQYRHEIIRLVNLERKNIGLEPYVINDACMEYSQIRAEELVVSYSHTRPDGTNAGYEIITGAYSPENAVSKWMNSDGHRAAILNANRVYVGAGCHITSNGTMFFQMYFERDPEVYANTLIFG